MKPSKILMDAARRVASGASECACDAIDAAGECAHSGEIHAARQYFDNFRPDNYDALPDASWWGLFSDDTHRLPENMNARLVALCLAAAIAKSDEINQDCSVSSTPDRGSL